MSDLPTGVCRVRKRLGLLAVFGLIVALGCGRTPVQPPVGLLDPPCSALPDTARVSFEDAVLEAAIRRELSVTVQESLTCALVAGVTTLSARLEGVERLAGIQNLTRLTTLHLNGNAIVDLSPLRGLTTLRDLNLAGNSIGDVRPLGWLTGVEELILAGNPIVDIGPLSGLTSLGRLELHNNPGVSDIQPLLDNPGLGASDVVRLENTSVPCAAVAELRAKGVSVGSDCR